MSSTLSIVLSFRNEEEVIPELIRRLREVLKKECAKQVIKEYELIFVNDASIDHSLELLMNAAKSSNDIKIINMSRTFGSAPCILAGMKFSTGDAVIYMDADLQDPPELIPKMLRAWKEKNADVIHTVRISRAGESFVKLCITKIGYFILKKISNIDIQNEAGDFKLLSRRAVNYLIQIKEKNPFMRGLVVWLGFKQVNVPYRREARFAGKTKVPIFSYKVINNFLDSALISFSDVPLKLVSAIGFLVSFGSFLFLIYVIIEKFLGHNIPGWSAIMVTLLFLGGLQLLAIGVLGLYINSIFLETKNRPNFIIESTCGFDNESLNRKKPR